jgi:hypothetical protein
MSAHPPAPLVLEPSPGARLGPFRIVSVGPNQLVLRGHRGKALLTMLFGLVLAAWGTMFWLAILDNTLRGYFPFVTFFLLPIGIGMAVIGIRQLIGVWTFDGEDQAIVQSGRLGKPLRTHRSAFTGVELNLIPSSRTDYESVVLRLVLLSNIPGTVDSHIVIGDKRTRAAGTVNVVRVAAEIARLLDLTLHVQGQNPIEGSPELLRAIAAARQVVRASA